MRATISRRQILLATPVSLLAARPAGPVVDTHIHLFAADMKRFPFSAEGVYKPKPKPLETYNPFVKAAGIDHVIIVHPEPYQDDHRYLKYCFDHEPSKGFFKGTCLYDPIAAETPLRMEAITKELPGRIVALRVHATTDRKNYPTKTGAIRDRDLASPEMRKTWKKAHELGLAIQMHMTPHYAAEVRKLAQEFRDMPVIIDHLARSSFGAAAQYEEVLRMAELPRVIMKFSGVGYSSKQAHPYADAKPLVRRTFDAFGADRMIWGGLGSNMQEFEKAQALFEFMFDFTTEANRRKIRGENAMKLFRFS